MIACLCVFVAMKPILIVLLIQAEGRSIWLSRSPMGRMGNPEELCGTVVMLCSGAGSYITGADFIIDGGQTVF